MTGNNKPFFDTRGRYKDVIFLIEDRGFATPGPTNAPLEILKAEVKRFIERSINSTRTDGQYEG